ncbi:MAG: hypothetical protein JWR50_3678, partial [Mucilaginibacter sp.]|nr:hypothetical protein [Mucilaginibacter sp.]
MKRLLGIFLVLGALVFVSPGCYS